MKSKIDTLEDLLSKAIGIAMNGDYRNGIINDDGNDEGIVKSMKLINDIVVEAKKIGVDIGGKKALFEKNLSKDWVFLFHDDEKYAVHVAPKVFWEKNGYIPDTCIPDWLQIPKNWYECMEHCLERCEEVKDKRTFRTVARKELGEAGFEEVKWEDGEFVREINRRIELGDEWDLEYDGSDPLLEERGKEWLKIHGQVCHDQD